MSAVSLSVAALALALLTTATVSDFLSVSTGMHDLVARLEMFYDKVLVIERDHLSVEFSHFIESLRHQPALAYVGCTTFQRVTLCGNGDDTWTSDGAITIDLGGDDTYLNRPATALRNGVSLHIDFGGDDLYVREDFSVASATGRGIALFADLAGNDRYEVRSHGVAYAEDFAVALFFDDGGDDVYLGESDTQAVAAFPIGEGTARSELWDAGGNDTFLCIRHCQSYSYGFSPTHFVNLGGDDRYVCETACRAAVPNIVYFLELEGNDTYDGGGPGADRSEWCCDGKDVESVSFVGRS